MAEEREGAGEEQAEVVRRHAGSESLPPKGPRHCWSVAVLCEGIHTDPAPMRGGGCGYSATPGTSALGEHEWGGRRALTSNARPYLATGCLATLSLTSNSEDKNRYMAKVPWGVHEVRSWYTSTKLRSKQITSSSDISCSHLRLLQTCSRFSLSKNKLFESEFRRKVKC